MTAVVVLVVDDNELNSKLVCDVLEAAGMCTLSAATAVEALALAAQRLPDIVLMDLRLPDLDGSEARLRLGSDPRTADIPVVAVSAVPLAQAEPWWRDAGFSGYLEKPIDITRLPDQIKEYCTTH